MPIDASPSGTLDIENATLRSRGIVGLTNMVAGNDEVRSLGAPTLEVYGDPSQGGNEATLELVSNTAAGSASSFTRLTSNAGVLSIQSGVDDTADSKGDIVFSSIGGDSEHMRIVGTTGNVEVGNNLTVSGNTRLEGDINMLHTSNTATLKINSNVVTEFPRSKKFIKYPRVAMTGETTSNYTVTASSWYNSPALGGSGTQYEPWKAFDNVGSHPTGQLAWYSFDYPTTEAYSGTDNAFNPNHGGTATPDLFTGAVQGEWLKIQLPHKVALGRYIMYGPNGENEFPRDWTVYGSADGTNWVRVDDRVSQIFGAGTGVGGTATGKKKEYQLDTQTNEYLYFAFVFTRGSVNKTQYLGVGEIELYGIPEYDPEADGVDVTVKSLPNVPNTDWLEVYYDAKDLADGSTTVNDLKPVGTAINGTVAGNTSVTDGAFTFDGSGDYIVSGNTSLGGTPTITYSVWFKTNSINYSGSNSIVMIGYSGNTNSLGFRINSTGHYRFYVYGGSGGESQTTDIIPTLGNWVHATVTYNNGTGQELYLNGKHVRSGYSATSNLSLAANSKVILGNYLNSSGAIIGTASYDGSIANFRLFNRALTSDEIYQLYAYQKEYFGHGVLGMTLKAGRLGIGTSEPRAALDVRGTISINGQILGLGRVSGGNDIFDVDGYRVHVFTTSGNFWVLSSDLLVDILLVGGGGGGGQDNAGGGGAGGLIFKPDHGLQVGGYTVIIGSGGSGCIEQNNGPEAKVGGNTEIKRLSNGSSDLVAYGGGAGMNGGSEQAAERNGGSGAGGASEGSFLSGGGTATQTGTYGYGNNGGTGVSDAGGGGGGAGVAGQHGSTDGAGYGGIGGDGLSGVTGYDFAEIFGTRYGELIGEDVWFAGGGAGANINYGSNNTIGGSFRRGGKGGGGGGPILSDRSVEVTSGLPNTGGGGNGAGWFAGAPYNIGTELHGGDGGSGIVIFRYKL